MGTRWSRKLWRKLTKRDKLIDKYLGKHKCPFKPSLKTIWGKDPISLSSARLLQETKDESFDFPDSFDYQTI